MKKKVKTLEGNIMSYRFDYRVLLDNFNQALLEDEDIILAYYLTGYNQLCQFCYLLGHGFGFIAEEIESKIKLIKDFQAGDAKTHFKTMKEMIQYEQQSNLLNDINYVSGCRTLLRLHRGLDFFRLFLERLSELNPDDPTHVVGKSVYDATLSVHHAWYVRIGAGFAMNSLPCKSALFEKVVGGEYMEEVLEFLPRVTEVTNLIYNRVQECMTMNNLLKLP